MNFHPQEVIGTKPQPTNTPTLQIEDLNNLIDSLKRREENIIQLLDNNLKLKNSTNHMDVVHLRSLYAQLNEREKRRIEQEELIVQKYTDLYVTDDYQKKLMNKMRNKILQLSSSAREKLIQLGILQQTKQAYLGISNFEEALTAILTKIPVNVHSFLTCLIENSRQRFLDEIDQETAQGLELVKNKAVGASPGFSKPELNLAKVALHKGFSSPGGSKVLMDDGKPRESIRIRNAEPHILSRKELSKVGRSPLTVKSVDSRPSFDFREYSKNSYDLPDKKSSHIQNSKEGSRQIPADVGSMNDTICEQTAPGKDSKEIAMKLEVQAVSINCSSTNNSQNMIPERTGNNIPQNFSSRLSSVKKVKISSSNNKKSMCLEETNEAQTEKDKEKKELKEKNKEAWLKNYDILKIEYQPLPTATKKETKKLLLEKIYNQLLATNIDIKKTMKRYRVSHLSYLLKKQAETEPQKEDLNPLSALESNRPKSLTPQSYKNSLTPSKPKLSHFNPNQRNLFYMDNVKEAEDVDSSTDNLLNILNPFCPSNSGKQHKDGIKKQQVSQKFLVLPKLNFYPEIQSQGIFPSWPSTLQGSKSTAKPNFPIEYMNRPRYEKNQKCSERIAHNFIIDTKQDSLDQEALSTSLVSQSIGTRAYSSFSNKNNFPLALQPLDPVQGSGGSKTIAS